MISASTTRTKLRSLDDVRNRILPRIEPAMMAAAEILHDASQKLVPRDTESLANSSMIRVLERGLGCVISVGYGRPDFSAVEWSRREQRNVYRVPHNYAVVVHQVPASHEGEGTHSYLVRPRDDLAVRQLMRQAINTIMTSEV